MQKPIFIVLIFICFFETNLYAQEAEPLAFLEIGVGYTFEPNSKYAIGFGLEKKFKKIDLFSFQLDYSVFKLTGGVTNSAAPINYSVSFPVTRQHISASVKWYPIQSINQPFSLFFVGLGAGYYKQWFAEILVDNGPSINLMIGGSYVFNEHLRVSLKTQYFQYYNFIQDRYKFNVYLFTIGVAYRVK